MCLLGSVTRFLHTGHACKIFLQEPQVGKRRWTILEFTTVTKGIDYPRNIRIGKFNRLEAYSPNRIESTNDIIVYIHPTSKVIFKNSSACPVSILIVNTSVFMRMLKEPPHMICRLITITKIHPETRTDTNENKNGHQKENQTNRK